MVVGTAITKMMLLTKLLIITNIGITNNEKLLCLFDLIFYSILGKKYINTVLIDEIYFDSCISVRLRSC